jgi:2,4-dienoyl-CoA reductase-like NADH-dependent reductase (Old Yellow Enzyme family)/thioredoxin reductase
MLFEPFSVGGLELKNRIVMAPMVTGFAEKDGSVSQQLIDHYVRRAEGGCGLIIVEAASIEPVFSIERGLRIDHDKYLSGMSSLADAIKQKGAKVVLQFAHLGKQAPSKYFGRQTVAPSDIPDPLFKEVPHVLTVDEIHDLVEKWVQAAIRAKEAGFDGIEIHGAHGYLISQFLSAFDNRRTDQYGGDIQNRALFSIEIVKGIKQVLSDFPIFFRISAEQYTDGLHLDEAKKVVRLLEDAGIDAVHVSAGRYASIQWMIPPMTQPQGCLIPLAAEIRRVARKPVLAVGRIGTPELAEQILQQGNADLIALGRPLFADPDFPKKGEAGKSKQIRPCIACNTCFDTRYVGQPVRCTVNPELKHGRSAETRPATHSKKIIVVGGGPGGMEAARSLALCGHKVALWEKTEQLGGQLVLAMAAPGRKEFKRLIEFYGNELKRLGVELKLGVETTSELLQQQAPEAVIVATGIKPCNPEICGEVCSFGVTAHDILAGREIAGKKVVIIGGAHTGCETAKFLAADGRNVTVTRRGSKMASEAAWTTRRLLMEELKNLGVTLLTSVEYKSVNTDGVLVNHNGEEKFLSADTVVLAAGCDPDRDLYTELQGKIPTLLMVGDCKEPRDATDAIEEGRMVAFQV